MADKIQIRRDTAANWTNVNPLLAQGELGYETDTRAIKVGDGITLWQALPYNFQSQPNHGLLSGLGNDDHTQYFNEARGDARYYTKGQVDSQQQAQDSAIALNTAKVSADGSINTHSDVSISNPASGEVLFYNGSSWVNSPAFSEMGWASWTNTNHSQSFNFDQRIKLVMGSTTSVITSNRPASGANWFDPSVSTFFPDKSGDAYVLRLNLIITPNQGEKIATIDLDIGGSQGVIWATNVRTARSGNESRIYTFNIPVFTLSTFVSNGGSFYLRMDTGGTCSGLSFYVQRTYRS